MVLEMELKTDTILQAVLEQIKKLKDISTEKK
jgi:hypothetical protein